jgi:hypothetical protein
MILWKSKSANIGTLFFVSTVSLDRKLRAEVMVMSKLNDEAAPNLNLTRGQIKNSNLLKKDHEFTEELSDGGERNEFIAKQSKKK